MPQFEDNLIEDQMYLIENFKVLPYNGDEISRAVRTDKHIYFTSETVLVKETTTGLKFPYHSFDFRSLDEMEVMKKDNRFLMGNTTKLSVNNMFSNSYFIGLKKINTLSYLDVVAVIEAVHPKAVFTKEDVQGSYVPFTITDGRYTIFSFPIIVFHHIRC